MGMKHERKRRWFSGFKPPNDPVPVIRPKMHKNTQKINENHHEILTITRISSGYVLNM